MKSVTNRYLPEKYSIIQGKQSNVALCTCWSDPELLLKTHPRLTDVFSIIGTLYSTEGVSILLRNLCLNPHIDTVFVWTNSRLSNTAIGKAGKELLQSLWEQGIARVAKENENLLHQELQIAVIKKVVQHVTLLTPESNDIERVMKQAQSRHSSSLQAYMEPVSFPEPSRDTYETMPSENVGWSLRGKTTINAWLAVVDRIMRYGSTKKTEYGNNQKELQSVVWTITEDDTTTFSHPHWPREVKTRIGLEKNMLEQYKSIFTTAEKEAESAYTYGSRLFTFPQNIDQIAFIIDKLRACRYSRRAFATTYCPAVDTHHTSPPCLTSIQFLSHGDRLNLFATFRSHDICKAALPNVYGLLALQEHVAHESGFHVGSLTIHSISAHMHEEDWLMAHDLLSCAKWGRVKLYFDETTDIEPRGNVRISLRNKKIHAELIDAKGTALFTYADTSARRIAMKFARLDLFSLTTHYVDISIELTKAEIALHREQSYIQDKPLIFDGVVIK